MFGKKRRTSNIHRQQGPRIIKKNIINFYFGALLWRLIFKISSHHHFIKKKYIYIYIYIYVYKFLTQKSHHVTPFNLFNFIMIF